MILGTLGLCASDGYYWMCLCYIVIHCVKPQYSLCGLRLHTCMQRPRYQIPHIKMCFLYYYDQIWQTAYKLEIRKPENTSLPMCLYLICAKLMATVITHMQHTCSLSSISSALFSCSYESLHRQSRALIN